MQASANTQNIERRVGIIIKTKIKIRKKTRKTREKSKIKKNNKLYNPTKFHIDLERIDNLGAFANDIQYNFPVLQ